MRSVKKIRGWIELGRIGKEQQENDGRPKSPIARL
jgi:hypothetical protein